MITLPLDFGIARMKEAKIQPMAGISPALNVPRPQPHAAHVAKMTTARMIAISGAGA